MGIRLNDITLDDGPVDAELRRWREWIETANNWAVSGHAAFEGGPTGYALHVKNHVSAKYAKTTTGGISARSGSTLGSGTIVLQSREGATLSDRGTALCYNNMPAVPHPSDIQVKWIDGAWAVDVVLCPEE